MRSPSAISDSARAVPQLHTEVEQRFDVLPNFFRLAPDSPEIAANLWGFARFAYLDNPLPALFKERLFVYLSRFCEVRYCIVRHLGFLVGLGRPSGNERFPVQTVEEVLRLLRRSLPRGEQAEPHIRRCAALEAPLAELPPPDSDLEEAIFTCAAHAFLQTPDAPRCLVALKRALGEVRFEHLMVFLAFVQTAHYWTKVHPELALEEDVEQLMATHEALAECLLNDPEAGSYQVSQKLLDELETLREGRHREDELSRALQAARESDERLRQSNAELVRAAAEVRDSRRAALNLMEDALQAKEALRESERCLREMIDALPAAIYTTDAQGRLTRFNPACVELSGRTPEPGTDQWCVSWKLYYPDGTPMPHDECSMAIALKEGRALRGAEAIAERPDGTRIWFQPYPTPLRDAEGRVVGGINMLVDITERKRAEEALRKREGLLAGQKEALQAALNGAPLETSLGPLVRTAIEQLGQDTRAAFYLANPDGTSLHHIVGMPAAYAQCVDGFQIGPKSLACGLATHTGQPVLTSDVTNEPLWEPWLWLAERFDYRGCWSFPIHTSAGKCIGTFAVYWRQPREATQRDLEFASLLTQAAAIIISRHTETEVRKRAERDVQLLFQVSQKLSSTLEMNVLLDSLVEEALQLVDAESGCAGLRTAKGMICHKYFQRAETLPLQYCWPPGHGLPGWLIQHKAPYLTNDALNDHQIVQELCEQFGVWSALSTPILDTDGEVIGFFEVHNKSDGTGFTQTDQDKLMAVSHVASVAIQNAKAYEAIRHGEEALRESESRFRALVTASSDVVYRMSSDWSEMRHLQGRDFIADTHEPSCTWLEKYIHLDDQPHVLTVINEAIRTKTVFQLEHRVRRVDGTLGWTFSRAIPILNADGEIVEWFGAASDVTRRKEAEEQVRHNQKTFAELVERAPFGIYIVDSEFRIAHMNPGSQEGAFRNVRPVIDRDFAEAMRILWPEPVAAQIIGVFRHTLDTGEPYYSKDFINPRDDIEAVESYEWELHRIRLPDGQYGVICYYFDSTRLRQAEQALKEADRRKDEFLATLAHELRNPLAPIRNSLHILRVAGSDSGTAERVHELMERQVNHMVRLVDDLMEVSRITRGKIELRKEPVELADVVNSAVETSRPLIEAARHQLTISLPSEPLILEADPVRLAQVLANLLNNAAKYTEEGGQIWLTARREGSNVAVSVLDTGAGIPAEMLPKVFDLFTQVDRTYTRAQGGLGIGLTLVRSLVDMHGGSVEVKSDGPGRGSEFIVRLSLAMGHLGPHDRGQRDDRLAAVAPHRILVVDDNRDAADSLGMLLKFLGADVYTAYDGQAALEAIRTYRPSVVLLDIGMPGMDGYEVARRARQQPEGRDVTLTALTGWGQEEDRRRSKEAGIDHHLVKPVDLGALQALLASLFQAPECQLTRRRSWPGPPS